MDESLSNGRDTPRSFPDRDLDIEPVPGAELGKKREGNGVSPDPALHREPLSNDQVVLFWAVCFILFLALIGFLATSRWTRSTPAAPLAMLILFLVPVAAYGHAAALTPPGKPLSERSVLGASLASYWRWAAGSVVVVFSALIGASASNPTEKTVKDLEELLLSLVLVGVPFVLMGLALRLWMAGDQHREKASCLLLGWAEGDPLRWLWRWAVEAALELSSSLRSSLVGVFLVYFCLAMLVCVPIVVVQGRLH